MFVENVVSGVARDLLAAAIERFEERGAPVAFHCHEEVTVETPTGSLSDQEFRDFLLKAPDWARGLPLCGKVHTAHYPAPPERPAEPLDRLEAAIDAYVDETRHDLGPIDDPALVAREDDEDFVASLPDDFAPLPDRVSLPLRDRGGTNMLASMCRLGRVLSAGTPGASRRDIRNSRPLREVAGLQKNNAKRLKRLGRAQKRQAFAYPSSAVLNAAANGAGRRAAFHRARSTSARAESARLRARPRSGPDRRFPPSSNRGAAIGGNKPKLTFIGWNERGPVSIDSMWPPVM